MLVRGENWEVINHQWTRFGLGFLLEFSLSIRSQQPWEFSVIRSLNLFAKGTKGLHKKWRQVMAGCSVQVQCTFTWVKSITRQPLLKCWLSNRHARSPNLHAFVFPQLQDFVFCFLDRVHCTFCEEKEDEPNSGVQRCKCSISKIMQNVSTLQEFTACCLSRLDGRYTMTFNWYLKKKKRSSNVYSVLQQFDRKKRQKRCSGLRVSYCFLVCSTRKVYGWIHLGKGSAV